MERLEKLVNILKLTPHRQPDRVKEAAHRILSKTIRSDGQIGYLLKPLLEILIQYCDSDDSAQRSLFNDYLNCVILAFQYQHYQLILNVLVEEVVNNGPARRITTALLRIPQLINNVQPVDLGCDPQRLLKALIEVTRRSDDESVQKSLDGTIKSVMPFLDYHVRASKEAQFLANSLIEILLRNLQNDSSQIRRIAASCIANICTVSELQLRNTIVKLKNQLDSMKNEDEKFESNKFVGLCLCAREIQEFTSRYYSEIVQVLLNRLLGEETESTALVAAFETLREILNKFEIDKSTICNSAKSLAYRFLLTESTNGNLMIRQDSKVILQTNTLACLSAMIRWQPSVLDSLEGVLSLFKQHQDAAIRNQTILLIGNYINFYWRFPGCVDNSIDCERTRKLWIELRSIIYDESTHPDTLKSCISSIKGCIGTLLDSDHCLHIVEYQDIDRLIYLYSRSNFKPLKIETLNLFSSLNYRTLYYLERHHWSKLRCYAAGSLLDSLQDRIINEVIIASLCDEHQRTRNAASAALIALIPNLYIAGSNGVKTSIQRPNDPIVSLASNLASEHMVVLEQKDVNMSLLSGSDESLMNSDAHDKVVIRDEHKLLTSSIIQQCSSPISNSDPHNSSQFRENISINLSRIVNSLKNALENSLTKGKSAIASLVRTLHELSLAYPIHEYSSSWDCRQSEYCDSFILLNFLMAYLENLTEPDVIIEDLEAYKMFLELIHQLLYALCHESARYDYESQRIRPYHKRSLCIKEGDWSELTIKHTGISEALQTYFTHLVKLLWLISNVIQEKTNPFSQATRTTSATANESQKSQQSRQNASEVSLSSHETLTSNHLLFERVHKKLESSFKSSKKNLNQEEEKFYQILNVCLSSISSLLEFIGMSKSMDYVRDILGYLKVTSAISSKSSLICARQLLKSLFGINIIALYQVDPFDWFEEEASLSPTLSASINSNSMIPETNCPSLQGVYHYLITNPYKIFSSYQAKNCSQITPGSDKALAMLNFESRRALKVRRRIEDRVKSLFEVSPNQIVSPKIRLISENLKNIIAEFTPIVSECMNQFSSKGFCLYQAEILHFMSYLLLLRVNYQKLPLANDMISTINKLLDDCGDRMYLARELKMEIFLKASFTFLTLLTYERGPSKPFFQVATIIQKFDDLRAKLTMASATERDVTTYIVPLLRCLVEDLFIYRTEYFQTAITSRRYFESKQGDDDSSVTYAAPVDQSSKNMYELLEAERETVAQKLLDVIDNPGVYDLLSILIIESRRNSSEIKYKKLSQHLLSIIPTLLSKRSVNLADYKRIELTRKIIENISPEVFQPINFIIETLLEAPKPPNYLSENSRDLKQRSEFHRWMSLVIITIHILTTQVNEERFLSRIRESMSDQAFVEYLLHIAQLCTSEIILQMWPPANQVNTAASIVFSTQQLSCYILYITHMFQSGLFFQLSRSAAELIKNEIKSERKTPTNFKDLCMWARNSENGFSLNACEVMFYHLRLTFPDLTINWCNVMSLLNNVDCNRDFWRNLLVYECHHCLSYQERLANDMKNMSFRTSEDTELTEESLIEVQDTGGGKFKRSGHINRPSSLNLSDIRFSDQLRRSFIKKIAATESRDKTLNRNIVETSDEDGQLLEREVTMGNTEQCLSPNVELTRRGALCLVLDYVSISMNDVEHITWLIIHHINDIIRWSHETPIADFINNVHGNSASSGIFIQAINTNFNNLTSISFVTRLLWTLERVHYTQYGSLVVLLVEKLLSCEQLMPYRSLTRKIEDFACETVQKLLNETNKSLVTTNDEVINQLTTDDLDRVITLLDVDLYPNLTSLLRQLRLSSQEQLSTPTIEFHRIIDDDSDEERADLLFDGDDIEVLYKMANLIYWLSEQGRSAQTSTLVPALNSIKSLLSRSKVVERVNRDESLICFLVSAIYSLALSVIPPPTRLSKPKFWSSDSGDEQQQRRKDGDDGKRCEFNFDRPLSLVGHKPTMPVGSRRPALKPTMASYKPACPSKTHKSKAESIQDVQLACLEGLFLFDHTSYLQVTHFECINEVIIRLARLPLINPFILTPPVLWRQNIWPTNVSDEYKINFPLVGHEILIKDNALLNSFCDRILKLGWTNRRQFEEVWMTLLGVLSATLSQSNESSPIGVGSEPGFLGGVGDGDTDKRANILASCRVITTLTKYLDLTKRNISGDPLASELYPMQSFDERVVDLTRTIATNLSALKKKTATMFEMIELDQYQYNCRTPSKSPDLAAAQKTTAPTFKQHSYQHVNGSHSIPNFSHFLRVSAHKLRLSSILNVDLDMQDTVVIADAGHERGITNSVSTSPTSIQSPSTLPEEVDVESCVRLILSIYKQKLKDPNQDLCPTGSSISPSSSTFSSGTADDCYHAVAQDANIKKGMKQSVKNQPSQLPPPLVTAIVQSILALSDLFSDYEQFMWFFETFWQLSRVAERNEDDIQMQYLLIGLCKAATICSYEIPNELTANLGNSGTAGGPTLSINQREVMFERCRQMVEKYVKSDFIPVRISALYGVFYMLEDSINIVSSGAWELDDFKRLRQMRLAWIVRLMPIMLDKENMKHLSSKGTTMKLLESLCETVTETELKAMKNL